MMLILHITIALLSIGFTTYLYFAPSARKLQAGYGFVVATLATGTALVFGEGVNMLRTCMTGLVYLAIVSVGMYAASRKITSAD